MTSPSNNQHRPQRIFIEICDWQSFQYSGSHRKADPPWKWFRLHNSFIESPIWFSMTKPQRADFVTLLSLASRTGNLIPKDRKWLSSHGISAKTLPSLEQLSLIRVFPLPQDDQRITELRSILSGGTPLRGEEKREEENRKEENGEDAPKRTSTPGVKDSNDPTPNVPNAISGAGIDLGRAIKSRRHDPRSFDELKTAVKPHIERFGADPGLIHRLAGPSLRMSEKQIATCVKQMVADAEVTLPAEPYATQ